MKTVLVVEDEEYARKFLAQIITRFGYKVFEAANGAQAMEMFKEHRPSLVFMDLMLPDIDGDDVLRQFAVYGPMPDVYFMTGYEDILPLDEMSRLGVKGYFVKPILVDKIKDVLEALQPA